VSSNMWKAIDEKCEICGATMDTPRPSHHERDYDEDGNLRNTAGCTIQGEQPYDGTITVCEDCLQMFINQEFLDLHQRAVRAEELGLR